MTIYRSFQERGGVSGKRYAFVGDLLRGRAVRSVVFLLSQLSNVEMIFVAPSAFQIAGDLEEALKINKVSIQKSESLNEILPHVDSLYMTRVQDEYGMSEESGKLDNNDFNLTTENLKLMGGGHNSRNRAGLSVS